MPERGWVPIHERERERGEGEIEGIASITLGVHKPGTLELIPALFCALSPQFQG